MNQVAERVWRGLPSPVRSAVMRARGGYGQLTSRARVLPDYVIIGTQRGGTTSLYKYLVRHPGHAHALTKELRFFDLNYHRGLDWYRSCFPTRSYRTAFKWFRGFDLVVGEASPDYMFHPHVPSRMARDCPEARFVVFLRNPVDRAWSHFWHQVKLGFEPLSFEEAIEREPERLEGELDRMMSDESYVSYERHHHSYLARGIYVDQLRQWTSMFARERFLIERSEDFFLDPEQTCRRVLAFLGLPSRSLGPYEVFNAFADAEMSPSMRLRLAEYFRPHNVELYEFVGRDFAWDG